VRVSWRPPLSEISIVSTLTIGPYTLTSRVLLAPMAGVTDRPFRQLCKEFGAGLCVSEMVTSDHRLWNTRKSRLRLDHAGEAEPRSVQIAGGCPTQMAEAARMNVEHGAQIIDINMGCPAKKVCNKAAGSALLKDEQLVADILTAVVNAVEVPVTLKIRTGWSAENRNGISIAKMAEDCGIQMLTVHGRTRACGFAGHAEYDTIADIKSRVRIPVIANGDITSADDALTVLNKTGADGVMIGRAAQGQPWIFSQINHVLATGNTIAAPSPIEIKTLMLSHMKSLYDFYGEFMGVRIARKHVSWYLKTLPTATFRAFFNKLETPAEQLTAIHHFFDHNDLTINDVRKEQAA
jgi:tRNA-dihydrouridine synthase B